MHVRIAVKGAEGVGRNRMLCVFSNASTRSSSGPNGIDSCSSTNDMMDQVFTGVYTLAPMNRAIVVIARPAAAAVMAVPLVFMNETIRNTI